MAKKSKQVEELEQQLQEATLDLQRTRADFENYRKRIEQEKEQAKSAGQYSAILKMLPIIDTIERAIAHQPEDLKDNTWVQGITKMAKNLDKLLESLQVTRIEATPGIEFNPNLHEAIQFDEDAEGKKEVIAEELQGGYIFNGQPIRHAMVKVTRQ